MCTDYKIFIRISHNRISYEYYNKDEGVDVKPINGLFQIPLAFYVTPAGVIIGHEARQAVAAGNRNAYEDFFKLLRERETIEVEGVQRRVSDLLLDASEGIFNIFYKDILLNYRGNLYANRSEMPLVILCENDILLNEKPIIKNKFRDSGYSCVRIEDYDTYIGGYLRNTYSGEYKKVLVVWGEDSFLSIKLFDMNNEGECPCEMLQGMGVDPRVNYVCNLIWDCVASVNPWADRSRHTALLENEAINFLNGPSIIVDDQVVVDGYYYNYRLNKLEIPIRSSEGDRLRGLIRNFLARNGVERKDEVVILLRGDAAVNNYFYDLLSNDFMRIVKSDQELHAAVMKHLVNLPVEPITDIRSQYSAIDETAKRWNELRYQVKLIQDKGEAVELLNNFRRDCKFVNGTDNIVAEVDTLITQLDSHKVNLNKLSRDWHEVSASAKGKARSGRPNEAQKILQDFINKYEPIAGTEDYVLRARSEYDKLRLVEPQPSVPIPLQQPDTSMQRKLQTEWREIRATVNRMKRLGDSSLANISLLNEFRNKCVSKNATELAHQVESEMKKIEQNELPVTASLKSNEDEGQKLVDAGKLQEAREWYRNQGNESRVTLLNGIVRDRRSLIPRKAELAKHQSQKQKEPIDRIVSCLEAYLNKCKEAGYRDQEFLNLLNEYKKIRTK